MMRIRPLIKNLAKLAGAGALIWGIALAVLTLEPQGEVRETQADVWDFSMFRRSHTQKFASALEKLGHEPPRVYELNGNEMFFSTRVSHKPPDELLLEYQQEFVAQGVNKKMHLQTPDELTHLPRENQDQYVRERAEATLSGEILPYVKHDDYVMMSGGLLRGAPVNPEEVNRRLEAQIDDAVDTIHGSLAELYLECGGDPAVLKEEQDKAVQEFVTQGCKDGRGQLCDQQTYERQFSLAQGQAAMEATRRQLDELGDCHPLRRFFDDERRRHGFDQQIAAVRSLEMFRDPSSGTTAVTAVWSDEDFDMRRVQAEKYGPAEEAYDPDVPVCPECLPLQSFGGTGKEAGFRSNLLISRRTPEDVRAFYLREMDAMGWERSPADLAMDEIFRRAGNPRPGNYTLNFAKGKQNLEFHIRKDSEQRGRTSITVMRSEQ